MSTRTPTKPAPVADAPVPEGRHALLMPVHRDWYALDIDAVREVVPSPATTDLPTSPSSVIGLFNLRGEIVPLFDTAQLLGIGRLTDYGGTAAFAVVVETEAGFGGLAATGFCEASTLGLQLGAAELPGTAETYAVGSRVVAMLDLVTLLANDRLGA